MSDDPTNTKSLIEHISIIADPRVTGRCNHLLVDIIVLAITAILCGADDWNSIEGFGKAKQEWFRRFLQLPSGIPSHDTFRRVFARISPSDFQECFIEWVRDVAGTIEGVIAIDGKTLRRSHDRGIGKKAIHMVSAWGAENSLVLGQVKTDEKSNEITAIPELLRLLDIKGCIVTIDAMGCQTAIAKQIIEKNGDYVLALKGNQSGLHEAVAAVFEEADSVGYKDSSVDYFETSERSRNRAETRRHWTIKCDDSFGHKKRWEGLNIIGMVECERTLNDTTTIEYRYYIGSIENNAQLFGKSVRDHWGIENKLHWRLDMGFREDESRIRKEHSAENFAVMRHFAINLLKQDKLTKLGVKNKRLKAGWDDDYRVNLLLSA
ncbi:MAG: ISAs1 family transposase [Gammaproteobacteria bacterium]|nr:ISAs1 family transposase [Gammaproteobacteria bacterium]